MNWSTRRTVISRSAKCFECRQNEFAHVALVQRTSARGEPPFQVEVPQPDDELPEGAAGGEVPESGREVVALSQARLQRMLGGLPGETRGFDATQLASTSRTLVRARTWPLGMVVNSICPNVPTGVRGRDISSLPIAGTSRRRFALLRDPGLDIRDSELQVTTHADRTRAMTAGAPLVDRLDRHTEVVGELLGAQQRLQRRQVVRQGVHVDQVCARARSTRSRSEPLGSRSGVGRFSRRTGHESGGFLEGGSNLRRFQARRSQISEPEIGRADRIRTCDPLTPRLTRAVRPGSPKYRFRWSASFAYDDEPRRIPPKLAALGYALGYARQGVRSSRRHRLLSGRRRRTFTPNTPLSAPYRTGTNGPALCTGGEG